MARPRKTGLDYFPIDVNFFSDERIVCIGGEFGIMGEMVALRLLCAAYRNGYYALWSDAARYKMLRELPGLSDDLLGQIVGRLIHWGLFDATLFEESGVLTSREIQQVYFEAVRRRRPDDPSEYPYLLIEMAKTPAPVENEENQVNVGETTVSVDINEISVDINATNKTKQNKTKQNQTKKHYPLKLPRRGSRRAKARRVVRIF